MYSDIKTRDLTIGEISQLQELQIELLRKVTKICDENDLSCFAYYGTLLGVVRHQNHIPWDDDIDIAMPRKDFNRFLKLAKNRENVDFKLWWLTTDKNYPFNFAKIVGRRDQRFHNRYPKLPEKFNGPRMDIFPLDSVGESCGRAYMMVKALKKMEQIGKRLGKKIKLPLFSKKLLHCFLSVMSRNPRNKYYISFFSAHSKEQEKILKRHFFNEYCGALELPFGSICLHVPINYEIILTRLYGDFMKYPPFKERLLGSHYMKKVVRNSDQRGDHGRG